MRAVVVALLMMVPVAAQAETPLERYLASRDAYVEKLTEEANGEIGDAFYDEHKRALIDLEAQLKPIVGPVAIAGFAPEGTINLDTLVDGDIDFGLLDGLVFNSAEDGAKALVTTDALLAAWLGANGTQTPSPVEVPASVDEALRAANFYTQAISNDAAFDKYAEIPVTTPAAASFAFAMLDFRSQDIAPGIPDEVAVSVLKDGRVYLLTVPTKVTVTPIKACNAIWDDYINRAEGSSADDDDSEAGGEDYVDLREEGGAAFLQCFGERAKDEPFFPALISQAQALVDRVAGP